MHEIDPVVLAVTLILITGVLPILATLGLVLYRLRAKTPTQAIGGGIDIPLVASQTSTRRMPWLVWAFNLWNPRLALYPDAIEYRLFRLMRRPYSGIVRVDYVRTPIGTSNVILELADSRWSFVAWVPGRAAARDLISRLQESGCVISPRAAGLLRS